MGKISNFCLRYRPAHLTHYFLHNIVSGKYAHSDTGQESVPSFTCIALSWLVKRSILVLKVQENSRRSKIIVKSVISSWL